MERVLMVMTLDMKKKRFFKDALIYMFTIEVILFLISMKFNSLNITPIVLQFIPYISLVTFCFSMTQEFRNKTDKIVFTGIYSRTEIIISKLIGMCTINLVLFVLYQIMAVLSSLYSHNNYVFDLNIFLNSLFVFILFAFTFGSFVLLVSSITQDSIITGIVSYVLYFDLILALFGQALISSKNEMIKAVIRNLPFYILNTGFFTINYDIKQSIVLICSGIIFLVTACVIINKKNL